MSNKTTVHLTANRYINLQTFCFVALCSNPDDITNGMMTLTGNSVDDTTTYTCNSGFELIGDVTSTCTQEDMNFATFLPAAPVCRREYSLEWLHTFSFVSIT